MIQITKEEAKLIRENIPGVHIKRTTNKWYTEERPIVLKLIGRSASADR